jgi:hypothetical protein
MSDCQPAFGAEPSDLGKAKPIVKVSARAKGLVTLWGIYLTGHETRALSEWFHLAK